MPIPVKVFICIDEHGNYRAMGASSVNNSNINTVLSIIKDGIEAPGVNSVTTSFDVVLDLPQPMEQ